MNSDYVPTFADPDTLREERIDEADRAGWDAGVDGKKPEDNPYKGREYWLRKYWEESRQAGARER